jgi:hypothetical protein
MDLHPILKREITAVVGFELGYGENKEARISTWQPRCLKEGEEGLNILDVEAVIDLSPCIELGLISLAFPIIRWICRQYHQDIASSP